MDKLLKLAIAGADGKMGKMLIQQTLINEHTTLASAYVVPESSVLGKNVGEIHGVKSNICYDDDLNKAVEKSDVLIDFTRPQGTIKFLEVCQKYKKALVIGTTGFSEEQREEIVRASANIPILLSANMALGVNVLFYLTEKAASLLANYDAEIFEVHHKHKVDAPSGTAMALFERILQGRKNTKPMREMAIMSRVGHTGERPDGTVGFSVARGGDTVGEHSAMFLGEGERIELRHISTQRVHYANGAIAAAIFLHKKPASLYSMAQVLGL